QGQLVTEQSKRVQGELAQNRHRQDLLTIRSPVAGRFVLRRSDDLAGRFVRKGELIGFVTDFESPTAVVVVPEDTADLVRARTEGVELRVAGDSAKSYSAAVLREVPHINDRLPSLALSTLGGGEMVTD